MKYLKYFEDYDYDGEPVSNAYGIADDPIIKAIMANVHDITNITLFEYEICEAIYWYIHNYNEDIPYIHYLRNVLDKVGYKISPLATFDNMEEDSKQIYEVMTELDINKIILHSFEILSYLKNNDPAFLKYLEWYRGENEINTGADMGDLGFK